MPRPSLKIQRTQQIINAAMQCVARYGINGLTLDRVAETAGLARPLIRHNIGNREQLITAVTQNFIKVSAEKIAQSFCDLPDELPLTTAVHYLFDTENSDTTLMLVAEALIVESANDAEISATMRHWLNGFIDNLKVLASQEFPSASKQQCMAVATGITGIYFTVDSMAPISGLETFRKNSKKSALLLIKQLADSR